MEKEALKASGIKWKKEIANYLEKLDHLHHQFIRHLTLPSNSLTQAKGLFDWLWKEKPDRYKRHGNFRLSEVIDAQLSKDNRIVGNCLGLTLLYNCLLRKMGIHAQALYLENAFKTGPHVLTFLQTKESFVDIENILPEGFGYEGHLSHPLRIRWGDQELVADIYLSIGNEFFKKNEFMEALRNYNMAIRLNPRYEKTYLNKAILLGKMRKEGKQASNGT